MNGENIFPTVNHLSTYSNVQSHQDGGSHLLNFTSVIDDATQNVNLSFCFQGDFGSASSEYISIIGENGASLGQVSKNDGNSSYGDCGTSPICVNVQIPLFLWNNWNNDDTVQITLQTSSAVNAICGLSSQITQIQVQYEKYDPHVYMDTSIGLNDSLQQYPFASPNSNTTYLCQASDGRCIMEAEVDVVCTNLSNNCQSMTLDRSIDGNVLTWTHIYSSNVFFQIERSFDGISFDMIDIIPSTTSSALIFSYLDYTAESKWDYYYRVGLLTDIDQLTYSCPISHIKGVSTQQEFDIFPNPTGDQLFISTEIRLEETSITI